MNSFSATLHTVAAACNRLKIGYLIGGSLASSARGVLRATLDVDILARLSEEQADAFVAALGPEWYADATMIRDSIRSGRSFNVIHHATGQKFDIFPTRTEFHAAELERATLVRFEPAGEAFPIATAEDVLLAKLDWYKSGGEISERPRSNQPLQRVSLVPYFAAFSSARAPARIPAMP